MYPLQFWIQQLEKYSAFSFVNSRGTSKQYTLKHVLAVI